MSIEYFDIQALNRSTTGTFSYDGGSPVLQFAIGDVEKYLIGNSLRLSFDFKVFNTNGTQVETAEEVGISSSCGVHSIVQQLDISSYKSNLMLESIRNYGRMVSSLYNCGFADDSELLDKGTNEGICQSQRWNNQNVGIKTAAMTSSTNYTIPLYSGLLMSQPVFLGANGLRGLKININLAPSSNVIHRLTGSATYTYEISNVKLIGQYYNPTDEEFAAGRIKSSFISSYEGVMRSQGQRPSAEELETAWTEVVDMGGMGTPPYEYYSITSYVDSLNSNQSSHSLNLGLSQIRSVFMNWIPSSYINNFAYDGMVCRDFVDSGGVLAPVVNFKTSRAGVLFPSRFDITTNAEGQLTAYTTNDRRSAIYQGVVNAIKVFYENHYQSGSYKNAIDSRRAFFGLDGGDKMASKTQGLGVNFSNVSNVGVDFSFSPFQFEIQTLITNAPVNHTLYIFAINKNTLVFQNNNVRVLN
tara:strand:+ start:3517 stop:4926 length:1410 start_codon:yes stop_codon:yes gene_type:complete